MRKRPISIDKQIRIRMDQTGFSRLRVIANMSLGERSKAAERVIYRRIIRLVERGNSLIEAVFIVNTSALFQPNETEIEKKFNMLFFSTYKLLYLPYKI